MEPAWLSEQQWAWAQTAMPILCVDAIPVSVRDDRGIKVGLILRETPHQGRRWCLVGGRVRHGEHLLNALEREWHSALGRECHLGRVFPESPTVIEYLPGADLDSPHDPRKHAVSVTYPVLAEGEPQASGDEALEFRWFRLDELSGQIVGFGQQSFIARVVEGMVRRLGS